MFEENQKYSFTQKMTIIDTKHYKNEASEISLLKREHKLTLQSPDKKQQGTRGALQRARSLSPFIFRRREREYCRKKVFIEHGKTSLHDSQLAVIADRHFNSGSDMKVAKCL